MIGAILTDLDVVPTGAFLLYFIKDFLRDNCFVISGSVSAYYAAIVLPLCLVFQCVGFEDNSGAIILCVAEYEKCITLWW